MIYLLFILYFSLNIRYKGKSYRATVEVVRTADRVADFCRKTCIKLECCPNLFGPRMVLDHCTENCSVLTKTKYSRWFAEVETADCWAFRFQIGWSGSDALLSNKNLISDCCDWFIRAQKTVYLLVIQTYFHLTQSPFLLFQKPSLLFICVRCE